MENVGGVFIPLQKLCKFWKILIGGKDNDATHTHFKIFMQFFC